MVKKLLATVALLITLVGVGMAQEVIPSPSNILNAIVRGTLTLSTLAGAAKIQETTTTTSGQLVLTTGDASAGVGLDVSSDGILRVGGRTFANGSGSIQANAMVLGGNAALGIGQLTVGNAAGTTFLVGGATGISTIYNGINLQGIGLPAIVRYGRAVGQTNTAVSNITQYTVGAADGTFEVSCNVLVTVATSHSFGCSVAYTDESSASRTVFLDFATPSAYPSGAAAIVNTNGAVPYDGTVRHIRAKTGTTITIATVGTFGTVTYNVEAFIKQIA